MLSFASTPLDPRARREGLCRLTGSAGRAASQPFQLAGNIRYGGLVELAFGATLRELVEGFGGGTRTGRPIRAVQVGGPLGAYLPESLLDTPLDYESMAAAKRRCSAMAASWSSTTASTWRARRASLWSSAPRKAAASARPAGSVRPAGVETVDKIIAGRDRAKEHPALARSLRGA